MSGKLGHDDYIAEVNADNLNYAAEVLKLKSLF